MRALLSLVCAISLSFGALGTGTSLGQTPNACGCYRDDAGACRCTKQSKCGCPEECEPVGCEARRQRQAEREANAALKRIAAEEKKKGTAAARASKKKRASAPREVLPPDPVGDAAAEAAKKAL